MKRLRDNQYFNLGAMLMTVVAISFVLLAIVLNLDGVKTVVNTVVKVFGPIIFGFVLAYLMNPLMNFLDRRIGPFLQKRMKNKKKALKTSRTISLVLSVLVFVVLVYEFFAMLMPQLYTSIVGIVNNFSTSYEKVEKWIMTFLADNPELATYVNHLMDQGYQFMDNWFKTKLLSSMEAIISGLTNSLMTVVGLAFDFLIGLCAAIYMLASRDLFMSQSKKLVVAVFKESTADHVLDLGRRIHKVFSGFIIGKLVDSLIIGVLCYIGMLILRLPYPALIATVVGVTNVIPFFGPFIGAVPSAFLILLNDPMKAVYFCIFVLALQQLDGNVIGPRILGDTIGIAGFWVLVSITVAGGLFGFAGMVLGVPVFAVFYMLMADFVQHRLQAKGMTVETKKYQTIQTVSDLGPKNE